MSNSSNQTPTNREQRRDQARRERNWEFTHFPTKGGLKALETKRVRLRVAREPVPMKVYENGQLVQSKAALTQMEISVWDADRIKRSVALERYGKIMPDMVIKAIVAAKLPVYEVAWYAPEGVSFVDARKVQVSMSHFVDCITGNAVGNKSMNDRRYLHAVTEQRQVPVDAKDPSKGTMDVTVYTHVIVGSFDKRNPKQGYEDGDRILILTPTANGRAFAEIVRIFLKLGLIQKLTNRLAEDHDDFAEELRTKSVESLLEASIREARDDEERDDRDRRRPRTEEVRDEGEGKKPKPAATAGAETAAKPASFKYGWCGAGSAKCDQDHVVVYSDKRQCAKCGGELRVSKSQGFNEQMHSLEQARIATGAPADAWAADRLKNFKPKDAPATAAT